MEAVSSYPFLYCYNHLGYPMPNDFRIHCNLCHRSTRHGMRQQFEEINFNGEVTSWQIVQCGGCDSISFYQEHSVESEQGWEVTKTAVYPLRQHRAVKHFVDAPANLDQLYRETIDAYNSLSFLFCAGGLRALVEGICADQGVSDGPRPTGAGRSNNLECKIEGLAERGILTQKHAAALHEHRYLGNRALHELEIPDRSVLEAAITILEYVMEGLYSLQSQTNQLITIRQNLDTSRQ